MKIKARFKNSSISIIFVVFIFFFFFTQIPPGDARRIRGEFQNFKSESKVTTPDEILAYIERGELFDSASMILPSDKIRLFKTSPQDNCSNCMGYVMGIEKEINLSEFLSFLTHYEEISAEEAQFGDLVLYVKGEYILHVGIYLENDRVRSKWNLGPVFEHHIDFVPEEWREGRIKFYRCVSRKSDIPKERVATPDEIFRHLARGEPFSTLGKRLPSGIRVIQDASGDDVDCLGYLIGREASSADISIFLESLSEGREVTVPQRGDIVVYYDYEGGVVHVGMYIGNGMVRSKWGVGGPVVEHDIHFVPPEWKDGGIRYYRIQLDDFSELGLGNN